MLIPPSKPTEITREWLIDFIKLGISSQYGVDPENIEVKLNYSEYKFEGYNHTGEVTGATIIYK